MPFPEASRVIYKKNPLAEVICQLRFPPILKIDADIPANFQDSIRGDFPNFKETSEWKVDIDPTSQVELPPEVLSQLIKSTGTKNYEFSTDDEHWKINLTRTFITLTTGSYTRWEIFKEKWIKPLRIFNEIYSPDYFSRIGLRYIDVFDRSSIGLEDVPWRELFQPYITGILSVDGISENVFKFENKYEIQLADGESNVRIITKFVKRRNSDEIAFMIDSDFFVNKRTNIENAIEKLDFFNIRGSRLLQWCITDRLQEAIEPEKL